MAPIRWRVFLADLDPVTGSEQGGRRPVLVVSNEDYNQVMPVLTVLPLTTLKPGRRVYPGEVLVRKGEAGLDADSLVLAHQVRTISRQRLARELGALPDARLQRQVEEALKEHLDLP